MIVYNFIICTLHITYGIDKDVKCMVYMATETIIHLVKYAYMNKIHTIYDYVCITYIVHMYRYFYTVKTALI